MFVLLTQNGKIILGKLGLVEQVDVIHPSRLSYGRLWASLGVGRASGGVRSMFTHWFFRVSEDQDEDAKVFRACTTTGT